MVDAVIAEEKRACTRCGELKNPLSFPKMSQNPLGRAPICKECTKKRQRAWETENRKRHGREEPVRPLSQRCRKCGAEKPSDQFHRKANTKKGFETLCIDCCRLRDRIRYRKDIDERKESAKWAMLKMKFGLSRGEWEALFDAQNGNCGICSFPMTEKGQICVDHDHDTMKIRGLLCRKCNMAIGLIGENPVVAIGAYKYLKEHGK